MASSTPQSGSSTAGCHSASTIRPADPLPGFSDRPDADLFVIYDGECNFCRTQLVRLEKWDRAERIAYVSLHDPKVYTRWPQLSKDALMEAMCLVDAQGRFHWGPDVFRFLSRQLPSLWWLVPLLHIPFTRGLQKLAYRWIARQRYRLSGRVVCDNDKCDRHFD